MKVKELIAYLSTLDQEAPVMFSDDYWMGAGHVGELKHGLVPYSWSQETPDGVVGYYWD